MTTPTLPRRSPEEIKTIARDLVTNRIFLSTDPDEIRDAFGVVLIFLKPDMVDFNQVAAVFEYYSEAGPTSINGLPTFFSMQVIHVDDWPELCAEARAMMKALGIELPEKEDASVEEDDTLPPEVIKWMEGL